MNTLKINIPEGYKIDTFNEQTGEVSFAPVPKEITERIKSIDDAIAELGEHDNEVIQLRKLEGIKIANHILNNQLAVIIAKALNEGWEPDWGDNNEYKYYPWFNMGGSSGSGFSFFDYVYVYSGSAVGSRLCFKSSDLAEYAAEQFKELYRHYFLLN